MYLPTFMRGRGKTPSTEYSIWLYSLDLKAQLHQLIPGADPGEVKWVNFHPLFLGPLLSFFLSYPSNIEIIFDFSDFSD